MDGRALFAQLMEAAECSFAEEKKEKKWRRLSERDLYDQGREFLSDLLQQRHDVEMEAQRGIRSRNMSMRISMNTSRSRNSGGGTNVEALPREVYLKIFCLVPARDIAGVCSLVCRSWRDFVLCDSLWKELCVGSGLRDYHLPKNSFRTWKALYGAVFGTNLIASPHFDRLDHIDVGRVNARAQRWCEPKHRMHLDYFISEGESPDEPHSSCHWCPVSLGGSRFQRGGGDGIVRECPPEGCPPFPGAPERPILATSYEWGTVQQSVDLSMYPRRFLDSSPGLLFSVWCAGKGGSVGVARAQILLRDKLMKVIGCWDSTKQKAQPNKWKKVEGFVHLYPTGLRWITVNLYGMSLVKKRGFNGAKFTAVHLKFMTPTEVHHYTGGTHRAVGRR